MGRRGPAGTPTNLKVLHGNPGHRPINHDEPKPRPVDPEPPEWLSPIAREEWDRVAPELAVMGTTYEADAVSLAAHCESVAVMREAAGWLASTGLLTSDGDGQWRRSPAWTAFRDAQAAVRAWAREFGLTPSARAGIRVNVHHSGGADPARLFTSGTG